MWPDKLAAAKDALAAGFVEYRKGDAIVQAQTDGNNPAVTMMFVPIARLGRSIIWRLCWRRAEQFSIGRYHCP
jgi:hypothetical protein